MDRDVDGLSRTDLDSHSNIVVVGKHEATINNNYEKAIQFYLKAIELDSEHPYSYSNLGNLYKDQGNYNR